MEGQADYVHIYVHIQHYVQSTKRYEKLHGFSRKALFGVSGKLTDKYFYEPLTFFICCPLSVWYYHC